MATADITVRGAGIFGLSIAWALARRGARAQVIDPGGPGAGASGGVVGALAPHAPEDWNPKKQFQLEGLLMAEAFWAEVEAAGGADPGYARTGRRQPVADDAALALARRRGEAAAALWGGAATWSVGPVADPGWAAASPTGMEILDTLSARVHPRRACRALAAALESLGVPVRSEGPEGAVTIHATGAAGLADLGARLPRAAGAGIKGQAALLDFAAPGAPQLFAGGLHVVPHADGTTAVGSTTEREYDSPAATDARLDDVIARARAAVPALRGAGIVARWAGLRPRSRSRAPMLGPWPGRPGHFVANGGFKIGFGVAPRVAQAMADLVLDGRDTIPPGLGVAASLRP